MTNRIYLPTDLAEDKEVILVGGKCYERVGLSLLSPDTYEVEGVYETCEECEAGSSSSSEGDPCLCPATINVTANMLDFWTEHGGTWWQGSRIKEIAMSGVLQPDGKSFYSGTITSGTSPDTPSFQQTLDVTSTCNPEVAGDAHFYFSYDRKNNGTSIDSGSFNMESDPIGTAGAGECYPDIWRVHDNLIFTDRNGRRYRPNLPNETCCDAFIRHCCYPLIEMKVDKYTLQKIVTSPVDNIGWYLGMHTISENQGGNGIPVGASPLPGLFPCQPPPASQMNFSITGDLRCGGRLFVRVSGSQIMNTTTIGELSRVTWIGVINDDHWWDSDTDCDSDLSDTITITQRLYYFLNPNPVESTHTYDVSFTFLD